MIRRLKSGAVVGAALLMLVGCGVPLQSDPEPLESDVVPTSLHVEVPAPTKAPGS